MQGQEPVLLRAYDTIQGLSFSFIQIVRSTAPLVDFLYSAASFIDSLSFCCDGVES